LLSQDQHYMQLALDQARLAEQNGEVPVGAILVKDDTILASAYNQPISQNDPTAHAEIVALRVGAEVLGNYRLIDTTLYVTLEPCAMCIGAILHARVKRLVFSAFDPRAGAVTTVFQIPAEKRLNHRLEWQGGALETESAALLKAFFLKRRKGVGHPWGQTPWRV